MIDCRATGERLVAAAKPRFKDFRVDFEKISTAASKAAREGRDGLPADSAAIWFFDLDWHVRLPLQRRYAAEGAFEAVAKYHDVRFRNHLGRNDAWPDEPGQAALDLFAEHGRGALGVVLARTYVDMQLKRLRSDYSTRNPRASRKERADGVERAIQAIGKVIAGAIPDRKAEFLRDLETLAPYLAVHASEVDKDWLETVRREIWMERRA